MGCKQDKYKWFNIEQRLTYARPEMVLKWTNEGFSILVDVILNGDHYDELPNANEVRLEHLNEANEEYKKCIAKLTAMIKEKRGEALNETATINPTREKSCEEAG